MDNARKTYSGLITSLPDNGIFVFGSNTQGIHGAGAASVALKKFGAIYGNPRGLQGHSYAIITKDLQAKTQPSISKERIVGQIESLYQLAEKYPKDDFYISHNNIGANLNYYTAQEMAEMYARAVIPTNIIFEENFLPLVLAAQEKLSEIIW